MSSDGRLQRRFMESRGNQGLDDVVESGGSGWRVREEEEEVVGEKRGERKGDGGGNKKHRRRRRRVEIRTRVLSYVTPIGGGGGGGEGGGSRRASQSGGDEKAPPPPLHHHHHHHHRFRKTTPCRETWLCSQRSDSGFLATAVVLAACPFVGLAGRATAVVRWAAAVVPHTLSNLGTLASCARTTAAVC